MKKQITIITLGIFLISLTSAIDLYAGESYSFESEEFEYYTVVGNSSDMNGMNVSWENGNTTIIFDKRFKPDTFTIILFNATEVIREIEVPGDCQECSSRTRYVYENVTVEKEVFVDNGVDGEADKEVVIEPACDTCNETVVIDTVSETNNSHR